MTQANVKQDANQDFDPADVATGGANLHTFTLTDAAHFRVAIPPEATEVNADLDVYVYGPDGALAATSTAGGTDEHIDIDDPADGAWKVYVHGWQTIGTDSDYTMWSWVVPNATGGSLTINSAPASAVTGATGTVTVGWTGLETGLIADWYLGAVSHTGPSGLIGSHVRQRRQPLIERPERNERAGLPPGGPPSLFVPSGRPFSGAWPARTGRGRAARRSGSRSAGLGLEDDPRPVRRHLQVGHARLRAAHGGVRPDDAGGLDDLDGLGRDGRPTGQVGAGLVDEALQPGGGR